MKKHLEITIGTLIKRVNIDNSPADKALISNIKPDVLFMLIKLKGKAFISMLTTNNDRIHYNDNSCVGHVFGNYVILEHSNTNAYGISVMCLNCGRQKTTNKYSLRYITNQKHCISCTPPKSIYEMYCIEALDYLGVVYSREETYDGMEYKRALRVDYTIKLPSGKYCCIEYNGVEHPKNGRSYKYIRDRIKYQYCYSHDMPMLLIHHTYKDYDQIENIICAYSTFMGIKKLPNLDYMWMKEVAKYLILPLGFDTSNIPTDILNIINNNGLFEEYLQPDKYLDEKP